MFQKQTSNPVLRWLRKEDHGFEDTGLHIETLPQKDKILAEKCLVMHRLLWAQQNRPSMVDGVEDPLLSGARPSRNLLWQTLHSQAREAVAPEVGLARSLD